MHVWVFHRVYSALKSPSTFGYKRSLCQGSTWKNKHDLYVHMSIYLWNIGTGFEDIKTLV